MNYFPKSILCLLFLVFLSNLNSQTITVIDSETETTIPSVLLFNENKSVSKLTDFEGKISIDIFNKKALYIYIREMVDVKTPKITKIANQLYDIFKDNYIFYIDNGYVEFE